MVVDCESTRGIRLRLARDVARALGAEYLDLGEIAADALSGAGPGEGRGLMPKGQPEAVPQDGLTTRQRRNRPLTIVHTGAMKGKSTAAFGMALRAWNQGWDVGVFQFVKSAKWKVGEENALRALGELHAERASAVRSTGTRWARAGAGPARRAREQDHAAAALEGWRRSSGGSPPRPTTSTCWTSSPTPCNWGWVDVDEVVQTLGDRPGHQHVVITGRDAPAALVEAADLVTEMTKVKHPMDAGQKGQRGIEW